MTKKNINKWELNKIFDIARTEFINGDAARYGLDSQQFITYCYLKALSNITDTEFTVSETIIPESIED